MEQQRHVYQIHLFRAKPERHRPTRIEVEIPIKGRTLSAIKAVAVVLSPNHDVAAKKGNYSSNPADRTFCSH
jgi:hypothetical protein